LPTEVLSEGLDEFELVGSETREVLERRPASCVVVAITYRKFVRKDRERGSATEVFAAPTLELPIDRGLAGPSMLADTIVRRWQDHQPLTRLEDIYRREQLDLAKSTLCA
jgi:transposase